MLHLIMFEYSYCLTFKIGAVMGGLASHSLRVGSAGHVTVTIMVAWVMSAMKRLDSATVALALLAGTAVSVAEIVSSSHSRAVQVSTMSEEEHGGHKKVSFWIWEFQKIEFELHAISFQTKTFWGRYFRNISAVSSDCKMYMEFRLYFPQKRGFLLWKMQ